MRTKSLHGISVFIKKYSAYLQLKRTVVGSLIGLGLISTLGLTTVFGAPAVDMTVKDYSQCANDDGDGYATGDIDCRWSNGNLQSNNSRYHEGDATVQRLLLEDVTIGDTHTVTFKYGTTKGAKHAYDFLTTDTHSELSVGAPVTSQDICDGASSSKLLSCSTAPVDSEPIPADPLVGGRDNFVRLMKIRNGTITNVSTPEMVSGDYSGDSETAITVSFTVPSDCANKYTVGNGQNQTQVCAVLLSFGAHISKGSDWGVGTTAVNIPGSPYHVSLDSADGESIGQRDNQMQADAVILPSTVTIRKVTDPASDTTTSFPFTTTGTGLTGFNLMGGGQNQQVVNPGTYTVVETNPSPNYALTGLTCGTATGTGTSATTNVSTRTVSITIGAAGGGNVDCTYTNTLQQAHLTLIKTVTNDNGGTAQDTDWTLNAAGPMQIFGATATAGVTNIAVTSGSYTLSESGGPSGYSASTFSCVTNNGAPVISNSITLAPNDNAVCTINNNDVAPALTLVKVVTNDNGGTELSSAWTLTATGATGFSGTGPSVTTDASFDAGSYNLSESGPSGYAASNWVCVGGTQDDSDTVTVGLGQSATCTITNNDIAPQLHLRKIVTNNNGGTASVTDFTLSADGSGANDLSGVSPVDSGVGLLADTFALSETNLTGYAASNWVCVGGTQDGTNVTVGINQSATCTITNDDVTGTLTIVKNTIGGNGQFNFTVAGPTPSTPSVTTTAGTGSAGPVNVNAGTYTVLETASNEWSLTSATCSDGSDVTNIQVSLGENVICTFTNTKIPKLTIIKITNPVTDIGQFNLFINGTEYANNIGNGGTTGTQNAVIGANTFAEAAGTNTNLADYDSIVSGDGCSGSATAGTITLLAGDDKTCTITNTRRGQIIVNKVTNPAGDSQIFDFTTTGTGYSNFSLSDTDAPNSQQVSPGSYTVAESAVSDWDSDGGTCDNGETPTSLNVEPGETVTCTFTNTKRGRLIVQKTTIPAAELTSFVINNTGTGTITNGGVGSVTDATDHTYEVTPGTYSVTETVPTGWDKTGDTCQNVVVAAGQTVTCLLTNTKRASLTIVKDAQPNDLIDFAFSGSLGSFLLDDDMGVVDAGIVPDIDQPQSKNFPNLLAEVYTVTETMPNTFWTFGGVSCVLTGTSTIFPSIVSGTGTSVTLTPGTNVTCTFVNTKQSPTRTQGFWQTHTAYTSTVFASPTMQRFIGVNLAPAAAQHKGTITDIQTAGQSQLFGAFFSNIAKQSNGKTQRSATDKARMALLQQLVAAKLNCAAFSCASSVQSTILSADAAYASDNKAAMTTSTTALDAYNNSGDTIIIGNAGKATPAASKLLADYAFWDQP